MSTRRALHFVFKVGDRKSTAKFYREVLGMKILRHEEFEEGCKASCNGPYDGRWSKTMVGYGAEDNHFVVELTYNYGIGEYKLGNDFLGMTVRSSKAVANAKSLNWPLEQLAEDKFVAEAPGGYKFYLIDQTEPQNGDPVQRVALSVSNLKNSIDYWKDVCGMSLVEESSQQALLSYDSSSQCHLELTQLPTGTSIDHGTAFGRIAFSCPKEELPAIEKEAKEGGGNILTSLVSLDTPGKATVQVVILGDPDGHEICFVGDEAFRELSQVDQQGNQLLDKAMEADKSDEWYAKRKKQKPSAT